MKRTRYIPRIIGTIIRPDGTSTIQEQVRAVEDVAWWRLVWEWVVGDF
jgi:hypothetical protein